MTNDITHSPDSVSRKVIYDLGSNNGDDIPYYLKKGDVVVAVEANPALAKQIEQRFSDAISEKRLFVENCVLTARGNPREGTFHLHKSNPVLSQFPKPSAAEIGQFNEVVLPARTVTDLIDTYGPPFYIKIDVEHYDEVILGELFANNIMPPFISAESHSIEVFSLLVSQGGYKSFNLVDGSSVGTKYKDHVIQSGGGQETFSFPHQSAGPFGEDIGEPWMTADNFFRFLAFELLGWKDIHATTVIAPDPSYTPGLGIEDIDRAIKFVRLGSAMWKRVPRPLRNLLNRLTAS